MSEAERAMRQGVAISERLYGPRSLEAAAWLSSLGTILSGQSRLAEAESLLQQVLTIRQEKLGRQHGMTAESVFLLGQLKAAQGRYAEAETLLQQALQVQEAVLGDSAAAATTLVELASALRQQGRNELAEPLLRRALDIHRRTSGEGIAAAVVLVHLADLYGDLGRFDEAEKAASSALAIGQQIAGNGVLVVAPRATLARIYRRQGRFGDAESLFKANLVEMQRILGPDHIVIARIESDLADLYDIQQRYAEAEPVQQRVLKAFAAAFGPESDLTVRATNNLAWMRLQLGHFEGALAMYETASAGWVRRRQRELASPGATARKQEASELSRNAYTFVHHVRAAWRVMNAEPQGTPRRAELVRRSFELAQRANLTDAAAALAQMSVRAAGGSDERAALMRRYQDLSVQWQTLDQRLLDSLKQQSSDRNQTSELQLRNEIAATDAAITSVRQQIETSFPDYAALAFVKPLVTSDVRRLLREDEALLQVLNWGDDTFLWLATKRETIWLRRNISYQQMQNRVTALRCGLDASLWQNVRSRLRCRAHLGTNLVPKRPPADDMPPFDLELAHDTYKELLGGFENEIRGKHLIIVPTGPLTQLPFDVLVTRPPQTGMRRVEALRQAEWLGSRQPVTVLPSVSSLDALRRQARPSAATKPLLGFGNPLLEGPDASYAGDARRARDRQACPQRADNRIAAVAAARGSSGIRIPGQRSGRIDIGDLRRQLPLPDTVDELCQVAASLDAPAEDLHLGARASERQLASRDVV